MHTLIKNYYITKKNANCYLRLQSVVIFLLVEDLIKNAVSAKLNTVKRNKTKYTVLGDQYGNCTVLHC